MGVCGACCPEEAIGRCGGDRALLEQGVREKRIIKAQQGGLLVYYFPQFEHSREKATKNAIKGDSVKQGKDVTDLDLYPSEWDPSTIIPQGLQQLGHVETPPMLPSCSPMLPASSSSLGAALPALTFPSATQGLCVRGEREITHCQSCLQRNFLNKSFLGLICASYS